MSEDERDNPGDDGPERGEVQPVCGDVRAETERVGEQVKEREFQHERTESDDWPVRVQDCVSAEGREGT